MTTNFFPVVFSLGVMSAASYRTETSAPTGHDLLKRISALSAGLLPVERSFLESEAGTYGAIVRLRSGQEADGEAKKRVKCRVESYEAGAHGCSEANGDQRFLMRSL